MADTVVVGVKVESTGLAYALRYDGGMPSDEELKEEEEEPERPEAAMALGCNMQRAVPKTSPDRTEASERGRGRDFVFLEADPDAEGRVKTTNPSAT